MIQKNDNVRDDRGQVPAKGKRRVLVAEDDDDMRKLLVRVLHADGYETVECPDGVELFAHLEPFIIHEQALDFHAIVADIRMPGLTGLEILEDLHDFRGFPPTILITAFGDKGIHARARVAGAVAILDKPFGINELLEKLHEVVPVPPDHDTRRYGDHRQNEASTHEL